MKNYFFVLVSIMIILGVGGFFVFKNQSKKNNLETIPHQTVESQKKINYEDLFRGEINVCEIFPKEKIEELLGKSFVAVNANLNKTSKYTQYFCEYHQEEPKMSYQGSIPIPSKRLPIAIVKGEVKGLREAYKLSGYSVKQESSIPFPHQLIYDQKGQFRTVEIFLADDTDLIIAPFQSNLTQEEALNFVKKFASYLKDYLENKPKFSNQSLSPTSALTSSTDDQVSLSGDEDILKNFISQIDEKRPEEAAKMMKTSDKSSFQANSELQGWAVQFSSINSFKLLKMEKANQDQWTDNKHIYKVLVDVRMDPRSAHAPIPYYGWQNGENVRWITLEKVDGRWKIAEIATGP